MGKIYDNWGKLVEAVVLRERLVELAMCDSRESSSVGDSSSTCCDLASLLSDKRLPVANEVKREQASSSIGDGSFRLSFKSHFLFSDQSLLASTVDLASSASYEALPAFKDVHKSKKLDLFMKKIEMCCVKFKISDTAKKQIKRQTLLDLLEYVTCADTEFTETVMETFIRMVSVNIFRDFTPRVRKYRLISHVMEDNKLLSDSNKEDAELVALDPAWPHLEIVYKCLLRFVVSTQTRVKVARKYIDPPFILNLLDLFDSEDPRERGYVQTVLHHIYGKFIVHRLLIRDAINDLLSYFVFETGRHNGIAELLGLLGCIVEGLLLPLKEEYVISLKTIMIPLHKPKCLASYHQQLSYCILQFITGMLKYWPVTNTSKEVLFLSELEEILEVTPPGMFEEFMVPLFQRISYCLSSPHFWVAESSLLLLTNDRIKNLVRQKREVVLPIIFPALERNITRHWNKDVRSLTQKACNLFINLDSDLFSSCRIKFQEDVSKENELKERRILSWKRVDELAAEHPGTIGVLVPQSGTSPSLSHEVKYESFRAASRYFMHEDPPMPCGRSAIAKLLQKMYKLKSLNTDLEFEIDSLGTARKDTEEEIQRSKYEILDLKKTNTELQAWKTVIKKEQEKVLSQIHDLQHRNRFMNKELEKTKSEIDALQVNNNYLVSEIKSSREQEVACDSQIDHLRKSKKELTLINDACRWKIMGWVAFFAVVVLIGYFSGDPDELIVP